VITGTGKVITLEMGPGYQKAKNTIGPDLKSFLGITEQFYIQFCDMSRQELQQFLGGFLGVDRADNTPVDEAAVFLAILGSHVNISEREWGMKWHGGHGPRPIAGTIAQGLLSGPLFFQESGCQLNRLNTAPQKILAAGHNPQVLGLIMLRSGSVSQHRRYELAAMCGRSTFSGILPWLVDACPSCGNVTGHKSVQARGRPPSCTKWAAARVLPEF
jgi:hypothetical protein